MTGPVGRLALCLLVVGTSLSWAWGAQAHEAPYGGLVWHEDHVRQDPDTSATRPDTILSRADSARLRILDRIRGPVTAPPPADTTADTVAPPAGPPGTLPAPPSIEVRRPTPPPTLPTGADSVMRALAALPGYRVMTYEGETADFQARERHLVLWGTPEARARFSGQGQRVEADSSITYSDATGRIWTTGHSIYFPDRGDPLESQRLIYDVGQQRATAIGARTTYREGANWIVEGNLDSVEEGRLFGSQTRFTSCELDPPHSHFRAGELKVVANQVLVARGVRMYVEDVPVLWLPFIAQNLGSGRASGILTPSFSVNDVVRTSTGYNRRISNLGYYWAMSDYSDLTVAMDWFSDNYVALTGGLRYAWRRQFLQGTANVRHYWRDTGRRELALDTRHNWEASERTRANMTARYVTSSDFVRQNTFDPREVTQRIESNAGFSHRFDWGNLAVTANRQQHLSDDRVDMTLPSVNLSLSTMTLFSAPPATASWYNNVSLGGGLRFSRDSYQRPVQPDTLFILSRADEIRTVASGNASIGLGDASLGGRIEFRENVFADVPGPFFPGSGDGGDVDAALVERMGGFTTGDGLPPALDPFLQSDLMDDPLVRDDFARANIGWGANVGYRLNLIGSTTFTPSLGVSGELLRTDSLDVASDFVTGPTRLSAGARLQTDLYGFYPGIGQFEAIRHKVTPSVGFDFSPQVRPTALQEEVFGARTAHPRKILTFGFNQTWEARLPEREDPLETEPGEGPSPDEEDPGDPDAPDDPLLPLPEVDEDPEEEVDPIRTPARDPRGEDDGPRRLPQSRVVNLLALNTSSVTYDIVQADSTGQFLQGFQTTRISNTVRSDYLRGLDLSFEHDLFEDPRPGANGEVDARRFAPHLSRLSFSFRMDHRSGVVQFLRGLLGVEADDPDPDDTGPGPDPDEAEGMDRDLDPLQPPEGFDQNRIMPGDDGLAVSPARRDGWDARISYSLRRPRDAMPGSTQRAQMLQWSLSFAPTQNWDTTWNTSYDLEARRFNDHMVQLRRDLHEWMASFSFRQTALGNWSFQFEISLRANQDLRFDYEQRNLDRRGGPIGEVPF